jgi:hypothetical protein
MSEDTCPCPSLICRHLGCAKTGERFAVEKDMTRIFYCPDCGEYYEIEDGEVYHYDNYNGLNYEIRHYCEEKECGCRERQSP